MDFIEINKFSELHDGKKIIFCKTDFLNEEFDNIRSIDDDVILITGNSDYPITDNHIKMKPKNVKKWYAQNALSKSDILIPLPLGLENKLPSIRTGHGIGYFDRVTEKEKLLTRNINKPPTKFIYSNFNINTNYHERIKYKNISLINDHIDWEDNNLTLHEYFDKIIDYKMVLCPVGNGIDTHRLWETLYSKRIPITAKINDFKIYDLYKKLPIIILDDINELSNKKIIEDKYDKIIRSKYDSNLLNYNYWKRLITNS